MKIEITVITIDEKLINLSALKSNKLNFFSKK
jgi:hypothetical protein